MKAKEEKIIIGFDEMGHWQNLNSSYAKLELFQGAIKEFQNVTNSQIENLKEFEKDIIGYTEKVIKDKHPEGNSLNLSIDRFFHLYGYNLSVLQKIAAEFSCCAGDIEMKEAGTYDIVDNKENYNIIVEGDVELEKYNDVAKLLEAVMLIYKKYEKVNGGSLNGISINKYLRSNAEGTDLVPDPRFIKYSK